MRLVELWQSWFAGNAVADDILWGASVRGWGRVGKFMQFLAGLIIITDLIDVARLRARGVAAREGATRVRAQAMTARRLAALSGLADRVIDSIIPYHPEKEEYGVRILADDAPHDFGPHSTFTPEQYTDFRFRVVTDILTVCPHQPGHDPDICDEQEAHVRRLATEMVRSGASAEEWQAVDEAGRRAAWLAGGLLVIWIIGAAIVGKVVFGSYWIVFGGSLVGLAIFGFAASGSGIWLVATSARMVHSGVAQLFDRERPLNVIRVAALILFVIGSHFDLLAS